MKDSGKAPVAAGGRSQPVSSDYASPESRRLAEARKQGEAEAEVVDLGLKLQESMTRERRLLETVTELQETVEHLRRVESEVRSQLDRHVAFHRDLERSLGWRILQSLRRLVGRGW
ncbi:MAG: hypothetical protein ABI610_05955 [Acidobacteriota bacterium]